MQTRGQPRRRRPPAEGAPLSGRRAPTSARAMRADADHREMVTIRARDKTTGKDLILNVPKDASMEEVRAPPAPPPAERGAGTRRTAGHGRVHAQIQRAGGQGALQGRVQARAARRARPRGRARRPAGSSPTGGRSVTRTKSRTCRRATSTTARPPRPRSRTTGTTSSTSPTSAAGASRARRARTRAAPSCEHPPGMRLKLWYRGLHGRLVGANPRRLLHRPRLV